MTPKITATLAVATLLLTGCSSNNAQAEEPEATRKSAEQMQLDAQAKRKAQEAQDGTPQAQDTGHTETEQGYLDDLDHIITSLDDDELIKAGINACFRIINSRNESDDPDTVSGSDIRIGTFGYMAHYENDPDNSREVIWAGVHHWCPELIDQFDYDAMLSGPFYDDFIDMNNEWRDPELRDEMRQQ